MTSPTSAKEQAAIAAASLVDSGTRVGLGTGSTAALVVRALARRLRDGSLRGIRAVATSEATATLARESGIELGSLEDLAPLDLTIDGADEVDPQWNLIKGAGGALLREKIVAQASLRLAVAVDASKLVARLGERMPIPLEVVPFGHTTHFGALRARGGEPLLRRGADGGPALTDERNYTLDVRFGSELGRASLADPEALQEFLRSRAGIVETGLFLGMTSILVVGRDSGASIERRES